MTNNSKYHGLRQAFMPKEVDQRPHSGSKGERLFRFREPVSSIPPKLSLGLNFKVTATHVLFDGSEYGQCLGPCTEVTRVSDHGKECWCNTTKLDEF